MNEEEILDRLGRLEKKAAGLINTAEDIRTGCNSACRAVLIAQTLDNLDTHRSLAVGHVRSGPPDVMDVAGSLNLVGLPIDTRAALAEVLRDYARSVVKELSK